MLKMEREFDIIVFGASGFTGELVVEQMARNSFTQELTWAVAGRNRQKVKQILVEVQNRLNTDKELKNIEIFEADVADRASLELMCENTRLLINCVGPYAEYGEPVVEACLKCKTHLVDMSVEIPYLDHIILKYYKEAESQGVYIISSCGILYLFFEMAVQILQQKFDGGINRIDVFIKPDFKFRSVHFATWNSYVNMSSGFINLLATRQKVYSEIMKTTRSKYSILGLSYPIKCSKEAKGISILYPSIMYTAELGSDLKEMAFGEKSVKVNYYWTLDSAPMVIVFCIVAFFLICMLPYRIGRWLLTKYAGFFSCGLVKKPRVVDETEDTAILNFTAVATGWSQGQQKDQSINKKVVLRGSGPRAHNMWFRRQLGFFLEPVQEPQIVPAEEVASLEKSAAFDLKGIPQPCRSLNSLSQGGVYMPLAAFAKTSLSSRLQMNEITYEESEKELVL